MNSSKFDASGITMVLDIKQVIPAGTTTCLDEVIAA
jgi:hypothetical protein